MKPIVTSTFDAADLVKQFPPRLRDDNLQIVYELAFSRTPVAGPIGVSRWKAMLLPAEVASNSNTQFEGRPDFFTYDPPAPSTTEWHLNFAHHDLFAFYGSGLFAQDEMQVAEHPALASVREALLTAHQSTATVEAGEPTPMLIRNVQRRVRVATNPSAAEGRPSGLYGNSFARATPDAIRRAVTLLDPPTVSNILAIEAPANGAGDYTANEIRLILTTAYTGFRAARLASDPATKVTIHTGFWGCGAYGGNRLLMSILQLHAARLAGINTLVFHAGDRAGLTQFQDAQQTYLKLIVEAPATDAFVQRLARSGYRWGISDGN